MRSEQALSADSVMPETWYSSRLKYAAAGAPHRAECNSLPRSPFSPAGSSVEGVGFLIVTPLRPKIGLLHGQRLLVVAGRGILP